MFYLSDCVAGTFSHNGALPCEPCGYGQYQATGRATSCEQCSAGMTTISEGMASEDECVGKHVAHIHGRVDGCPGTHIPWITEV